MLSGIAKIHYELLGQYLIMATLDNSIEETILVMSIMFNDN
jgi:hypothetical protein